MNRYKIKIEYDGTPFVGWQRQENGQSVQGCIEKAINNIFEENITIFGAGRTDAGVHAMGQVAHFDVTDKLLEPYVIKNALNDHLRPSTLRSNGLSELMPQPIKNFSFIIFPASPFS